MVGGTHSVICLSPPQGQKLLIVSSPCRKREGSLLQSPLLSSLFVDLVFYVLNPVKSQLKNNNNE